MKKLFLILTTTLLVLSCKNTDKAGVMDNQQSEIDSLKLEMTKQKSELAKQKTVDSMNVIMAAQAAQSRRSVQAAHSAPVVNNASTPQAKKKGWSGAAKGAVIGAGVGAVSGAVIAKKRKGEGAIIGGLAGAALGAGTGAVIDSEKKKKEAANQ